MSRGIFVLLKMTDNTTNNSIEIWVISDLTRQRDEVADVSVAILYIVLSTVLLITYFPTLYVLLRDESTMRKSCYKIMVSMGVADIVQVIGIGLVGGIFTLVNSTGGDLTNRIWGSAINMCWLANCFQGNILAFNRFISIWFPHFYKQLFFNRKTYLWIAAGYIYGISINSMYVANNADLIYAMEDYIWYYNITTVNRFCLITEISQDYINEGMSLIFCILIAVKLKEMRAATSANKLSKKDKAAIYQAVWISCSLMFYNSVYFCVVNVTTNKWAIFLGNLLWIWVNGRVP